MNKETRIENIKGIGEKSASLFHKLGIVNVDDLIKYYPRSYDVYEKATDVVSVVPGQRNAVKATVRSLPKTVKFRGKTIISFFVSDGNATCEVRIYNALYLSKTIKPGDTKVYRGFVKAFRGSLIIEQPKVYPVDDYAALEGTITPIYALTKDLTNEKIKKTVFTALSSVNFDEDYLSSEECKSFSMLPMNQALKHIHFPSDYEKQYLARRRIVFEEFLNFIRISREGASESDKLTNCFPMVEVADCVRFEQALPYELTNAQKRAVKDIFSDMTGDFLMNRLVQGDVGSGKTIVAVLALLLCIANGYQGSMMAPTEVLARQHFETIRNFASKYKLPIKAVLLTGKMGAKDRREALAMISDGSANVIIGTHALFQENVVFKNLALVITDEQHRFGVKQREAFKDKGLNPHILVMSATPIPRTLAMIAFAGLSVSIIDELPKNRIPISNCVVNSSFRIKAYEKIRSEIDKGHQAYVICPMVYENEENELGLKSVEQHSVDIADYFGEKYRIGTLSGKMKPEEKTAVMEQFKEHNIDILVSTTVIEVGIDVPNATVILIENAERFGLSQLHQLRGRVGRGDAAAFCILLSDTKKEATLKRLKVLNETNDGFKIAEEDMKLRGPGELNGVRQSGELQFGLGDIAEDGDILMLAASSFDSLKERMPDAPCNMIDFRTI